MYSYVLSFHSCWRSGEIPFLLHTILSFSPSPFFSSSDSEHITREGGGKAQRWGFEKGVSLDMIKDTDSLALGPPYILYISAG